MVVLQGLEDRSFGNLTNKSNTRNRYKWLTGNSWTGQCIKWNFMQEITKMTKKREKEFFYASMLLLYKGKYPGRKDKCYSWLTLDQIFLTYFIATCRVAFQKFIICYSIWCFKLNEPSATIPMRENSRNILREVSISGSSYHYSWNREEESNNILGLSRPFCKWQDNDFLGEFF